MSLQPFRSKSFSIDGKTELLSGSVDLKTTGAAAPIGSSYYKEDGSLWNKINSTDTDWKQIEVKVKNKIRVQKDPGPGEYSSIADAVASISDASSGNPYIVDVGPGIYVESTITMKQYVYVVGTGDQTSIITASSTTQTTIIGADNSGVVGFTITGATGIGGRAVYHVGSSTLAPFLVKDCYLANNETEVHSHGTAYPANITITQVYDCRMGGTANTTTPFKATNGDGVCPTQLVISNLVFQDVITTVPTTFASASGGGTAFVVNNSLIRITPTASTTGFSLANGAELRMLGTTIRGFDKTIHVQNTGSASKVYCQGVSIEESVTYDLLIEHPGTLGNYFGLYTYEKISIDPGATFFIANKDLQVINVSKKGGDYSSVSQAVTSITDASANKPYLVNVGPGIYTEPVITMSEYISLAGSSTSTTIIAPDANNHHAIELNVFSNITDITVKDVGAGYSAIHLKDKGGVTALHQYGRASRVDIEDCDIGIYVEGTDVNKDTHLFAEFITIKGEYTNAIKIYNNGGICACADVVHLTVLPTNVGAYTDILVTGMDAEIMTHACVFEGTGSNTAVSIENGAMADISATIFRDCLVGISLPNIGAGTKLINNGVTFDDCTTNINIAHPSASGNFTGYTDYDKTVINASSSFFITNKDSQIITVAKKGGDFTSIKDAVDSITDASVNKPYVVEVGAGIYTESPITMKQYVYVKGVGSDQSVTVLASGVNDTIFTGADNSGIENLLLTGATGVSGRAVYHAGSSTLAPFTIIGCLFGNNYTQAEAFSAAGVTILQVQDCRLGGTYNFTNGFKASGNPGIPCQLAIINLIYQDVVAPFPTGNFIYVTGVGNAVVISGLLARGGTPSGYGLVLEDGAEARVSDASFRGFLKAIWVKNVGSAPLLKALATAVESNTEDLRIDHPGTTGSYFGSTTSSKVYLEPTANYPILFQDITNGSVSISGTFNLGFSDNTYQDVSTLLIKASTMGVIDGGEITTGTGLNVNIASGFGYLETDTLIIKRIDWAGTTVTLPANQLSFIYINSLGNVATSATLPDTTLSIILGKALAGSSTILSVYASKTHADHTSNRYENMLRIAFGPIYSSGSAVTENATPLHLDVSPGLYYFATNSFAPSGGTDIDFLETYGGVTVATPVKLIKVQWDNAGTLTNPTASYYVKHSLYVVGDGANEKYFLVYGQEEFASQLLAENGGIPLPSDYLSIGASLIANIIVQQGNANIVEIQDARPRIGFKATGTSTSSDHNALSNLGSLTAHSQYLLKANTDAMGINLDMGGFSVTNVNLVDGVDVSAHASRHLPNGADPLTTAAPATNLSGATTNAEGNANSMARSNHTHAIDSATISIAGLMSATDKTKLDNAIIKKAGTVAGTSFAGNPKTYTVAFSSAMPDTNYSISISGEAVRTWSYLSKTINGFIINSNANTAFTTEVSWIAIQNGESI